ncbi:hypothetical protein EK904_006389 [Melospiza melodia maxima]|nr:hypothetical protein EK904_006389 [Melospiza melodia maxima]
MFDCGKCLSLLQAAVLGLSLLKALGQRRSHTCAVKATEALQGMMGHMMFEEGWEYMTDLGYLKFVLALLGILLQEKTYINLKALSNALNRGEK